MGQKTHPTGFRVGIIKPWVSTWYAKVKDYAGFVAEEPGRGNFVYNCLSNLGFREDAIQNIMRFFGYDHPSQTQQSTISLPTLPPILPLQQQQGQQPQRSGISFNLFNWGLFGGKK